MYIFFPELWLLKVSFRDGEGGAANISLDMLARPAEAHHGGAKK